MTKFISEVTELIELFSEVYPVEADEDEEDRHPSEERPLAAGKVGAKKQRKLEEKQARKVQREVMILLR